MLQLFDLYSSWYVKRHFHGVRIANSDRFKIDEAPEPLPCIVFMNHPSWWDPLTCITVYRALMPGQFHYAPMDAAALAQYGFFRSIGLFPVELGTSHGALQFLRGCRLILGSKNCVLWITPQGRFTDPRARPIRFMPGLGALVHRLERCMLLPLAFEYTHWDERLPEVLINCGSPIRLESGRNKSPLEWTSTFEQAMESTQDELAALSYLRDRNQFETLLTGRRGIGGVYELWQRVQAGMTGRPYHADHSEIRAECSSSRKERRA